MANLFCFTSKKRGVILPKPIYNGVVFNEWSHNMNAELNQPQAVTEEDVLLWNRTKAQLAAVKEKEAELRNKVFSAFFNHTKGSETFEFPDGTKLKATAKENIKVHEELIAPCLEALRNEGVDCSNLFRYKPDLSMTEYNRLSDKHKSYVDYCLTRSPGSPVLALSFPVEGEPND